MSLADDKSPPARAVIYPEDEERSKSPVFVSHYLAVPKAVRIEAPVAPVAAAAARGEDKSSTADAARACKSRMRLMSVDHPDADDVSVEALAAGAVSADATAIRSSQESGNTCKDSEKDWDLSWDWAAADAHDPSPPSVKLARIDSKVAAAAAVSLEAFAELDSTIVEQQLASAAADKTDDAALKNAGADDSAMKNAGADDSAMKNAGADDSALKNAGAADAALKNAGADNAALKNAGADDSALKNAGADDAAPNVAQAAPSPAIGVSAEDELRAMYATLNPSSSRPPAELSAFTLTRESNFFRGCKFSPDGLCLLTNSADNRLRLFNMPRLNEEEAASGGWKPALTMQESDLIYDMCWYPGMNSNDPATCCFAACSRDSPVRLWDAFTGEQRAQYAPYNHLDELQAPYSLAFSPDGSRLYCGFERHLRVFDVHRPGKQSERRPKIGAKPIQGGIISALACTPARPNFYACGSYNRTICLLAEPGSLLACMRGQLGGVTQLQFSPCGNLLYSGGRKDAEIHCWDVRRPGMILATMRRVVATNQRLQFDLDPTGRYLVSPCYTGKVRVFDLKSPPAPTNCEISHCAEWPVHADACNSASLSPTFPLLATCSGQRHIRSLLADASSSDSSTYSEDETDRMVENRLRLFSLASCLDNSRIVG